jgi:hypothetical protein
VRGFLATACFAATAACSFAQCIPTSRSPRIETFATIKAIAGHGEAGSQLRLREVGKRVTATLLDEMGDSKSIETQLTGTLTQTKAGECKVHLSGRNKDGQVEIEGEIMVARFLGTATRHVGKNVFSHAISLRRKLPSETPQVGSAESTNILGDLKLDPPPDSARRFKDFNFSVDS